MDPVSATTTIDAPRERVYELLLDLAARPAFCDHLFEGYHLQRLDPVGSGAAARFRLRGSGSWMETVIVEASPPHLIREHGRGGRLNRVPTFAVWELARGSGPGGCEVTVTFWSEPSHPLDRLREPLGKRRWFRRNLARALERLKELVESEREPARVAVAGSGRLAA